MPRRNRSKGHRPQAQRGAKSVQMPGFVIRTDGRTQHTPTKKPRPTLLPMVPSTGLCPTGKIRYGTEEDAAEALRRALVNREVLKSEMREERYYPMPGDKPCVCGGFHLTHTKRRSPNGSGK